MVMLNGAEYCAEYCLKEIDQRCVRKENVQIPLKSEWFICLNGQADYLDSNNKIMLIITAREFDAGRRWTMHDDSSRASQRTAQLQSTGRTISFNLEFGLEQGVGYGHSWIGWSFGE